MRNKYTVFTMGDTAALRSVNKNFSGELQSAAESIHINKVLSILSLWSWRRVFIKDMTSVSPLAADCSSPKNVLLTDRRATVPRREIYATGRCSGLSNPSFFLTLYNVELSTIVPGTC